MGRIQIAQGHLALEFGLHRPDGRRQRDLVTGFLYLRPPPGMVDAMRHILLETGIAEEDVRREAFYGY